MNIYIWIFIGIVVILAASLTIVGLRNRREESPLDERLNEYISRGEEVTLEEIELSQPITERVIVPIVHMDIPREPTHVIVGKILNRRIPENLQVLCCNCNHLKKIDNEEHPRRYE